MKKKTCQWIQLFGFCLMFLIACQPNRVPVIPTMVDLEPSVQPPSPTRTLAPSATTQPELAMFRGGLERSGVFDAGLLDVVEWAYEASGGVFSSPVVGSEGIFVGSMDGYLLAIDPATGQEKWKFKTEGEVPSSPALAGGKVYFGSGGGYLYALDAQDGTEVWKYKITPPGISSPAVAEDTVYFGTGEGLVIALNAQTGNELWKFQTEGPVLSSPAVSGELLFVGSGDHLLYALDRASGQKQWVFLAGNEVVSSPAIAEGRVYAGSADGYLYAVDYATGKLAWKYQAQGPVASSPAVVDGIVYFGSYDEHLYALDALTGQELWKFRTQGWVISSPAVAGGAVYFGSLDGRFYTLNSQTGQQLWQFQTQDEIWSSPAVAGDAIYFGSDDEHLYALRRQAPQLAMEPTATARPALPTPTVLPTPVEPVALGTEGLPWWNDRIFYEVFVRSFYDSDGNGIGDLQGLIEKLDYLNDGDPQTTQDLGVTGLWLMPVSESPSYHGYDVIDYQKIEQDYGTNEDLKQLIAEAHRRDMIVIVDLVMNHTSSQHPWFVDAQIPGSEHESWYIWQTERPDYFSPWGSPVWHKLGIRYYYGLFWEGMPDLNYNNGAVTAAMFDTIRFWLEDMGVDGFRLDAVRHLIENGEIQANTPATHHWLQDFHSYVRSISPRALTVGEAWDKSDEVVKYIGGEVDLAFEFDLAQAMIESVWRGDNFGLFNAVNEVLAKFPKGQYATFLTNHDQNRAMTQVSNDVEAAKAAASLLLAHPGVPFIYYGEEVGMRGAKPDERIRTPMQWDPGSAAGFTTGTPWQELAPDHAQHNVEVQSGNPNSILNHYRSLIRLRQEHPALRAGDIALVNSDTRKVYSFIRYTDHETILVIVNLSKEPVSGYQLSLESGPLAGKRNVQVLLGEGQPSIPQVSPAGGFSGYTPLPTLEPHTTLILQIK